MRPATETDFGAEPEAMLRDRLTWLDGSLPVLDIGCGVGRNLLWLARQGLRGVGIESDPAICEGLQTAAAGLPVTIHRRGFESYQPVERHGTVLVFGLLPLLPAEQRDLLLSLLPRWTVAGGLVFLTGFTDALDAGRWPGELMPGQMRELLPGAELLHHEEEVGPFHRHGDGPEHQHAWARAIFRF